MITSDTYVEKAVSTESADFNKITDRLSKTDTIRLLHAALGLCTEVGEFQDMLKKHIFYGKPIDIVNAKEEIGDTLWYIGLAIDVLQTTMNEIMTGNIEKLQARYPEKFNEGKAINRNLSTEREILEKI